MKNKQQITKMVMLAILAALTIVFTYLPIKFGQFQINLALIFIACGAILYGPVAGLGLGVLNGLIVIFNGDAAWFMSLSAVGTVITVLCKTGLAGLASGFIFKALKNTNRTLASVLAVLIVPILNTSIFVLGCLTFFVDTMASGATEAQKSTLGYILVTMVGVNFFVEIAINAILSPVIDRVTFIGAKQLGLEEKGE